MSARVELANPNLYASPQEYIEKHLAPAVAELQRLISELSAPGSTSPEYGDVDMIPGEASRLFFADFDRRLDNKPKHVVFDGSEFLSIPKELLRQKQLKVQLSATVYTRGLGGAEFRLVQEGSLPVIGSYFETECHEPTSYTLTLPFGNTPGCIAPEKRSYIIQARSLDPAAIPVCRRFSMSFVYI